jgi:hypothetical protein
MQDGIRHERAERVGDDVQRLTEVRDQHLQPVDLRLELRAARGPRPFARGERLLLRLGGTSGE